VFSIYHGEFWGNMKQGHGKLTRPDGSVYTGVWDCNIIVGTGKVTISVGNKEKRDGLPKEVRAYSYWHDVLMVNVVLMLFHQKKLNVFAVYKLLTDHFKSLLVLKEQIRSSFKRLYACKYSRHCVLGIMLRRIKTV
jgi:hypothetical protein